MHDANRNGILAALLHAMLVAGAATATYLGTHNAAWAGAAVFFSSRLAGALVARYVPPRRHPSPDRPVTADRLLSDSFQRKALLQEVVRRQRAVHAAIHDWLNAVAGVRGLVDLMTTEMHAMADLLEHEEQRAKEEGNAP